ncbi:MAG: NUDIX hydrolase [Gammaproteobacteria bacterium]|nr:NUDIX hydrolase [Gammaproteobacteria bacterium]
MNFCSHCGQPVTSRIPEGDDRERFVCDACGAIHYQNPKIVAGCIPVWEGQILLCKRAIAPRQGLWTLPAGFLELGETLAQGAIRETWEEARASVELDGLYTVFNLPHISQVYLFFRARLMSEDFSAGPESEAVQLFREDDIPWDELAFPVIHDSLRYYFDDCPRGEFPVRLADIVYPGGVSPVKD